MIFIKRLSEILDYDFDFSNFLSDDDEITNAAVTITPSGLIPGVMLYSTKIVKQYVSGGIDATDFTLTATIQTTLNRTKELDIIIRILGS